VIKRSNQKIFSLLEINPSIFIPPYNLLNNDTIAALRENNILIVSSSVKYDPPPYRYQESIPYRFPMTVSTGYTFFRYWYSINNRKIMSKINESVRKYGYAIILIHPQQYVLRKEFIYKGENGMAKLNSLIESVQSSGLDIAFIEEIYERL